jgi:AraC family transcriptional regulator
MSAHEQNSRARISLGSPVIAVPGMCRIELLPPASYETTYTPAVPIIGFAFDGQTGRHAFASSRRTPFQATPNHLSVVPSGCDVYSQSGNGGEYLRIELDEGVSHRRTPERRFTNAIDARAIKAAHCIRREVIAGHGDVLACEQFVRVLSERIVFFQNGEHDASRAGQWLTPRRLRLADEVIEARLAEKLTVQELASGLGLSAGFFSRAFKAAVGKAPHDYIVDRRVARARALLRNQELDLTVIALAAGFASHAHMTAVFRDRLGSTPSDIRRRMFH